jgi:hypothetical protein
MSTGGARGRFVGMCDVGIVVMLVHPEEVRGAAAQRGDGRHTILAKKR